MKTIYIIYVEEGVHGLPENEVVTGVHRHQ